MTDNICTLPRRGDPELGEVVLDVLRGATPLSRELHSREMFARLPLASVICNSNGIVVDCNDAYARILGRPVEEIIGHASWEFAPEAQTRRRDAVGVARSYGVVYGAKTSIVHPNGDTVPLRITGASIEVNGRSYLWCFVEVDLTQEGLPPHCEAMKHVMID